MQSSFTPHASQPTAATPHANTQPNKHNEDVQQQPLHPYHDADIAATLSLMPFSEYCKLRDVWAAKPLVRGRYEGLCGGDPTQRERREDFENISLRSSSSSSPASSYAPAVAAQVEPYSRSAAGKIIDPHFQRTPLALEKTMHFLVEHYLRCPHTPLVYTEPFRIWGYLWDRLRGIRTTWAPQLPPSNVSLKGYVDSESGRQLSTSGLHRESVRRVRWLEFTAAALAVGGAYLCLTPKGCQRFMQDKKQFLESMSQCFTDLTVFYRAEQRQRNAEFFSVLLLLYGLNQEMKVEDRATFCRFHKVHVNGEERLCPESPAESVNLAQVNRELERQPYMLDTQPVRAALELIYCWSTRRWFDFFALCKSLKLTPLQRAVVFQSFTYARYRAVLDLVLPNLYVYPNLRVRSAVVVDELASQLMMEPAHCLLFLKAMGLADQLELKLPAPVVEGSVASASAPQQQQQQQQTAVWHLNLCHRNSEPLVTAEELEDRCRSKHALFFPTYPEFFGFRVWHDAYARFPNAPGLARAGAAAASASHAQRNDGAAAATGLTAGRSDASPAGRGATRMRSRPSSESPQSGDDRYSAEGEGEEDYADEDDDRSRSASGAYDNNSDDDSYYKYEEEDEEGEEGSRNGTPSPSAATHTAPPSPFSTTAPPATAAAATPEAELLRSSGCPVNLMEVLEVYCPPYNADVRELKLVDASPALFAELQSHRSAMLRRCRRVRRQSRNWQDARAGTAPDDNATAMNEREEAWVEAKEAESASTCSSVVNSEFESEGEEEANVDDEAYERAQTVLRQLQGRSADHHSTSSVVGSSDAHAGAARAPSATDGASGVDASVLAVIAAADKLVGAVSSNTLYAAAAADKAVQQHQNTEGKAAEAAAASSAPPPLPHIPRLSLPLTGVCTVEPLPDSYGNAENGGADSDSANNNSSSNNNEDRCNAQNSHVTVESPASVTVGGEGNNAHGFCASGSEVREDSAETVEPQPPVTTSSASSLFPGRPGQPSFVFGAAKAAVPPVRFNTTMPTAPTGVSASASAVSAVSAAAAAAAAVGTDASTTPTTASRGAARHDASDGNDSDNNSRSTSSAPMLEYSHLKRRSRVHANHDGGSSNSNSNSDVEECDVQSGDASDGGASQSMSSTHTNHEVDLPPHAAATAPQRAASPAPASPPPSAEIVSQSFTPRDAMPTRRRRRSGSDESRDAAGSSSSSSEAGVAEQERERLLKRQKVGAAADAHRYAQLSLYLAPSEVNVFADVCVPLVEEYLELWTQLTEGDETALLTAADCVLRARASSSVTAARVQKLARTLARRARELLTTTVLRGSMSEYGLLLWDTAAHASTINTTASLDSSSLLLGELWTTSGASSDASSSMSQCRRSALHAGSTEVWAARFNRGCSAARIARYEVETMMAVESGTVPVLLPAQASRRTHASAAAAPSVLSASRQMSVAPPHALGSVRGRRALSVALAAALNTTIGNGGLVGTQSSSHGGVNADAVAKAIAATMDAATDAAAAAAAATTAFAGDDSNDSGSGGNDSSVVFDASIGQYVTWTPSGVAASAPPPSEAAVLQLTSTFVLISSEWHAHASSCVDSEGDTLQQQQYALETLFYKAKERWLAQLLLPSPVLLDAAEEERSNGDDTALHYASQHNSRMLWLKQPTSADAAGGPVLRLYQRDNLTNIPVNASTSSLFRSTHGGTRSRVQCSVPLATRVGLYACDARTLPRLRVRRDGGVRLDTEGNEDNAALPHTMTTTPAMAHAHYTAVVAVDVADAAAMIATRRTLISIVESHVPFSGGEGGTATMNSVAGVLLCLLFSPASDDGDDDDDDGVSTPTQRAAELEEFFWQQWECRHGAAEQSTSSAPAVVAAYLPYGDAAAASAAVARGMRTVMATYAQQAAAVLAEA